MKGEEMNNIEQIKLWLSVWEVVYNRDFSQLERQGDFTADQTYIRNKIRSLVESERKLNAVR